MAVNSYIEDIRDMNITQVRSYNYLFTWHGMLAAMNHDTEWLFETFGAQGILRRWYCVDHPTDIGYDRCYYFRSQEDMVQFILACGDHNY